MLTIELKTVDELNAIITELDVINYLQGLVQIESEEQYACARKFDERISSAHDILLDWQTASLDKLRTLLRNDGFTHNVESGSIHNCT